MTDIPKLKIPFTVTDGKAEVVEQDSNDELAQCTYAILATEVGSRVEDPEFGIPDQSHVKNGASEEEMRAAIEEYEPRINDLEFEEEWEQLKQKVRVIING